MFLIIKHKSRLKAMIAESAGELYRGDGRHDRFVVGRDDVSPSALFHIRKLAKRRAGISASSQMRRRAISRNCQRASRRRSIISLASAAFDRWSHRYAALRHRRLIKA